jgi:hypothetical protein
MNDNLKKLKAPEYPELLYYINDREVGKGREV